MLAKPIGPGHSPALVKQARVRAHALSTTREAMLSRERPAVTFDQPAGAAFELGLGGDAATGRLVAHIANRTVPAPSVGAVRAIDAADAALNELGAAHLGAVSDPLHVGVAALGRIERALDTLEALGPIEGIDVKALVPQEDLEALRERWYPQVERTLTDNLYQTVDTGLDLARMSALAELGVRGDHNVRHAVAKNLEPMLRRALHAPELRGQEHRVLELLQQFPPVTDKEQQALLSELQSRPAGFVADGLVEVLANMTPAGSAIATAVRAMVTAGAASAAVRAASVASLGNLADAGFSTRTVVRNALNDRAPEVKIAGLRAAAKLEMSETFEQIDGMARRNTDPESAYPITPAVKAAALEALAATAPRERRGLLSRDHVVYNCDAVFNGFTSEVPPDADPQVRQAAVRALATLSPTNARLSSSALARLMDIAKDYPEHREVAMAGVRFHFGKADSKWRAPGEWLAGLVDGDGGPPEESSWARAEMLSLLASRPRRAAIDLDGVMSCVGDPDPAVRAQVTRVLTGLQDDDRLGISPKTVDALSKSILSAARGDEKQRVDVAQTLATLREHVTEDAQVAFSALKRKFVRRAGAVAKKILGSGR